MMSGDTTKVPGLYSHSGKSSRQRRLQGCYKTTAAMHPSCRWESSERRTDLDVNGGCMMTPLPVVKVEAVALCSHLLYLAACAAQGQLQTSLVLMGLLHATPALVTLMIGVQCIPPNT